MVGALEVGGLDLDSGEPVYNFTERLKEFSPDLHDEMNNYFHSEMMFLWENGFVEMDILQDDPTVKLTAKAFNRAEVSNLDKDKQYTLRELIRVIRKES